MPAITTKELLPRLKKPLRDQPGLAIHVIWAILMESVVRCAGLRILNSGKLYNSLNRCSVFGQVGGKTQFANSRGKKAKIMKS
jgi:hypothetical protein